MPTSARATRAYRMDHALLGPAYGDDEIEAFLRWAKLPYRRLADVAEETAEILARDKIIGWFQGRMEFGPRAGRALDAGLADPRRDAGTPERDQGSRGFSPGRAGGA
jgi:carbamoyltransferase